MFLHFISKIGIENDSFQRMVSANLKKIKHWGMWAYASPESLHGLVPQFTKNFYMYNGSLTTPPCSEIAVFFISKDKLTVTSDQVT